MTTAARPTRVPAKGGNEQGGTRIFGPSQKYSSTDLAVHTNLFFYFAFCLWDYGLKIDRRKCMLNLMSFGFLFLLEIKCSRSLRGLLL